jgi:hypothetical protein
METYAALFICAMEFLDSEAACNTSKVHKGLFHRLKNTYTTVHNTTFRMLLFNWERKQYLSKRRVIYCGVRVFETMEKFLYLASDVLPALFNTEFRTRFSHPTIFKETCFLYKSEFQWRLMKCAHFTIYRSILSWYEHNNLWLFITHLCIATTSIKIHFCMIFLKVVELRKRQGNFFYLGCYVLCSYRSIKVILNCVFLFWALSKIQKRKITDNLPLWSAQVLLHTLSAGIPPSLLANPIQSSANTAVVQWVRTSSGLPHSIRHTATVQLHPHWNVRNIDFKYSFVSYTIFMWTCFKNAIEQNNWRYRHSNELCFIRECVSTSDEVVWLNKG